MKNKNIFIIFLFQLFYNTFSYELDIFYFNKDFSTKYLKINDEIVAVNNNQYHGDIISGSKISVSLDKNKIDDMSCVHVIGFINYTDVNDNKISVCINFQLKDYENEEIAIKSGKSLFGMNCNYRCYNITDDYNEIDEITFYGYVPLKCGNDRNFSVIIANEIDIDSYFKEFFDSTNEFWLYYISTSERLIKI